MTIELAHTMDAQIAADEYAFMRSFGMGHERACERVGVDPLSFDRRHSAAVRECASFE